MASLVCPICLDALQSPVTPPCGHMHCQQCLTDYAETQPDPMEVPCPTCQAPFCMVVLQLTFIPPKYHPYLQPPIRRVYLPEDDEDLHAKISSLEQQLANAKKDQATLTEREASARQGREMALKRAKMHLDDAMKLRASLQRSEQLLDQERTEHRQTQERERVANEKLREANSLFQWQAGAEYRNAEAGQANGAFQDKGKQSLSDPSFADSNLPAGLQGQMGYGHPLDVPPLRPTVSPIPSSVPREREHSELNPFFYPADASSSRMHSSGWSIPSSSPSHSRSSPANFAPLCNTLPKIGPLTESPTTNDYSHVRHPSNIPDLAHYFSSDRPNIYPQPSQSSGSMPKAYSPTTQAGMRGLPPWDGFWR